jgi:hypothetical protein
MRCSMAAVSATVPLASTSATVALMSASDSTAVPPLPRIVVTGVFADSRLRATASANNVVRASSTMRGE